MVPDRKIIVDADGCPRSALEICKNLGREFSLRVLTVASFEHNIKGEDHLVVGNDPQEVDIKIANLVCPGDIAVTSDLGLVALLLGRGAMCISPRGKIFTENNIEILLEERDIKKKYRLSGGRTRGPAKRSREDDRSFFEQLKSLLKEQKNY